MAVDGRSTKCDGKTSEGTMVEWAAGLGASTAFELPCPRHPDLNFQAEDFYSSPAEALTRGVKLSVRLLCPNTRKMPARSLLLSGKNSGPRF
jgi:hypothetical protein